MSEYVRDKIGPSSVDGRDKTTTVDMAFGKHKQGHEGEENRTGHGWK